MMASRKSSSQLKRRTVHGIAFAGVVALSLLSAACGGGSSGAKVAQTGTTTTNTGSSPSSKRDALVAFSACMRKNGVPNFPDPKVSGRGMSLSFGSENGIDPNAPQFKTAQRTCQKLLPNGGKTTPGEQAKQLQQALDLANCMREHGVPKYPDPKATADGGIDMGELGPGVDPNTPQFKAAQKACQTFVPGGG